MVVGVWLTSSPSVEPQSLEAWTITFHVSGGFAGSDRELELASTGELTAQDRRRGVRVTARAPAPTIAQIASLVRDVTPQESRRSPSCRDCFEYDVGIRRDNDRIVLRVDDSSVSGSAAEPFVKILNELLDSALTGRLSGNASDSKG
jgi:hypothetical protein